MSIRPSRLSQGSRHSSDIRRSTGGRAFAGLTALVLAISACGGGDSTAPTTTSAATTASSAEPPASTAKPQEQVSETTVADAVDTAVDTTVAATTTTIAAPAGTLRIGVATDLQTLDPHRAAPNQMHFLSPVYDSLTRVDDGGSVVAGLASVFESDDLVSWTIKLNEGATFSDGAPVDSAAVVFSLERGKAVAESPSAAIFANIAAVEAVDDRSMTVTLASPNASFARDMSGLAGMIINPAAGTADLSRSASGSGPWTYDTAASTEAVKYSFAVRSDYWGPGVGVETLEYFVFSDANARTNALKSGQIDIAAELGPDEQAVLADFELVRAADTEPIYLQLLDQAGTMVAPLADQRVREALSLAIDREGINQALYLGSGIPTTAFWTSASPYYSADADGVGYDPDAARALLAEAGYPDGFSFTMPQVEPLRPITEAVQASWEAVGVSMTIELQAAGSLGQQMRDGTWPGNITIARGITPSAFFAERLATDAPFNPFQTDRSDLDAMAATARSALTDADASAAWADTYASAIAQGYIIVIVHVTTAAAVAPNVTGAITPPGALTPDVRSIRVDG